MYGFNLSRGIEDEGDDTIATSDGAHRAGVAIDDHGETVEGATDSGLRQSTFQVLEIKVLAWEQVRLCWPTALSAEMDQQPEVGAPRA